MRKSMDMTQGPFHINLIKFTIPIILSNILQLMFNACDLIVVGKFAGDKELAAVGATAPLIALLLNAFIGLSIGVNVVAAQCYGADNHEYTEKIIYNSFSLSVICGLFLTSVGIFISRTCLVEMNTPDDVIKSATLYMQIYMLGVPFSVLYNFGAAIMRAHGNSKQPSAYLLVAGTINLILNFFFVYFLNTGVCGVAIATAISQAVCAVLVFIKLCGFVDLKAFSCKKLKIDTEIAGKIFRLGIPASINSMAFNFANTQIQAAINQFGSAVMAGSVAATNIERFIYAAMHSVTIAATNTTAQSVGAGKKERIPKILQICILYTTILGISLSILVYCFKMPILSLYVNDTLSYSGAIIRLSIVCLPYFLYGIMEIFPGVLQGMGYSGVPAIITIIGICGFRILWIKTVFKKFCSIEVLYFSLPISWIITIVAQMICYLLVMKSYKRN